MEVGGSPEEGGVCGGGVGETQTEKRMGLKPLLTVEIVSKKNRVSLSLALSLSLSLSLSHRI